jgi:hypothetical protein
MGVNKRPKQHDITLEKIERERKIKERNKRKATEE